jgi:hypothetical protein
MPDIGAGELLVRSISETGAGIGAVIEGFVEAITPPVADAGPDQWVECTGTQGAQVTLDGSGSVDPDDDELDYTWSGPFGGTATGVNPTITLPCCDAHVITLEVTDGEVGSSFDTVVITVQDTTPPDIAGLTAGPNVLWPPNHEMVGISVGVSVSDICDAAPACKIVSVTSNEPEIGIGDGDTAPDWQITGDFTLNLRAERSGAGSGREYTINVECTDACGNVSTAPVYVTVPHDQIIKE